MGRGERKDCTQILLRERGVNGRRVSPHWTKPLGIGDVVLSQPKLPMCVAAIGSLFSLHTEL